MADRPAESEAPDFPWLGESPEADPFEVFEATSPPELDPTGQLLHELEADKVELLGFSPDLRYLALARTDTTSFTGPQHWADAVFVLDVTTGETKTLLEDAHRYLGDVGFDFSFSWTDASTLSVSMEFGENGDGWFGTTTLTLDAAAGTLLAEERLDGREQLRAQRRERELERRRATEDDSPKLHERFPGIEELLEDPERAFRRAHWLGETGIMLIGGFGRGFDGLWFVDPTAPLMVSMLPEPGKYQRGWSLLAAVGPVLALRASGRVHLATVEHARLRPLAMDTRATDPVLEHDGPTGALLRMILDGYWNNESRLADPQMSSPQTLYWFDGSSLTEVTTPQGLWDVVVDPGLTRIALSYWLDDGTRRIEVRELTGFPGG